MENLLLIFIIVGARVPITIWVVFVKPIGIWILCGYIDTFGNIWASFLSSSVVFCINNK